MGFFADFKKFAMRGNVIDLAVGVIIGASFGSITKSLVDDVMMPPLGILMGQVDFKDKYAPIDLAKYNELKRELLPAAQAAVAAENVELAKIGKPLKPVPTEVTPTFAQATEKGVTMIRYGAFINAIINFVFVAFAVFLVVKTMMKLQKPPPAPSLAGPTLTEQLLTEIRDSLKAKSAK